MEALITNQTPEGRALDYKRDLNLASDDDRKELARDVSSFANAGGGDLVYGVDESGGTPTRLLGVACPDFDATKRRIDSIVQDLIDPRIPGVAIHKVEDAAFPNGPIIVVRVPRSWAGPHMLSYKNQTHFFSRNNGGRQPLDVRQIGAAFVGNIEVANRIRAFRDERLGRVVANEMPIRLHDADARYVVQFVPLEDIPLDLASLKGRGRLIPPRATHRWNERYNLDGLLASSGKDEIDAPQRAYCQAFRNGRFEWVGGIDRIPPYEHAQRKVEEIHPFRVEAAAVKGVDTCSKILRAHGYDGPAVVMIALVGARGVLLSEPVTATMRARFDDDADDAKPTIDRDPLVLPDVMLERVDMDPRATLRPMFDALWQSGGWDRSPGYDDVGVWLEDKHAF